MVMVCAEMTIDWKDDFFFNFLESINQIFFLARFPLPRVGQNINNGSKFMLKLYFAKNKAISLRFFINLIKTVFQFKKYWLFSYCLYVTKKDF